MKKIKILHIQVFPKLSGVQKVSLEIFKRLPENFDKYILFSGNTEYGDISECQKAFEETGAKVIFSDKLKREISLDDLAALKEIQDICKREKFDIVHTNSTKPGIVGRIGATLAGVPFVVHTIHGLAFHKFVKPHKWAFYWMCEMFASLFCDHITMVNSYYMKYFGWCKRKISVIYNGLRFKDFPVTETEPRTDGMTRILFVGRLDIPKNPLFLMEVSKRICEKYPNVSFTIVGNGEFYEECKEFKQTHGLDRVSFEGWQSNVHKFYRTHDILVVPSIYEAFGLIFLEAGYYSLPSVATNVEGIPEVIEDGKTGFLSDPKDIESFQANLERLIESPQLRKAMGKAARERVTSLFDSDKMAAKYIDLYNEGIAGNNNKKK